MQLRFTFKDQAIDKLISPERQPNLTNTSRAVAKILSLGSLSVMELISLKEMLNKFELVLDIDNSDRMGWGETEENLPEYAEHVLRTKKYIIDPNYIIDPTSIYVEPA